ncbi:MAG: hypothetical protein J6B09_06535, partial [Clostridia bacterium]|nr:hypothetical protein [Clostridia bacterium]
MAYRLTPYDRRVQAELIRKEREARYASRYPTYKKTGAAAVAPVHKKTGEAAVAPVQNEKEKNGFLKALHTIGDIGANLLTGLGKGVEGIVDLGAGLGGAVAGIFSDDAENAVKDWISTDWTGELYGNAWQEGLDQSALNGTKVGQIVEGVAQGVGQMLPAVAVSLIPGVGPALGAKLALGTTVLSAAGTGTEQAFQEGAGYGQGMLYGAASGAIEGVTEKLTGGAAKAVFGKGILDDVLGKVAKTGLKRVAADAVGEGVEEMLSEVANPALKSIYKGKDAWQEYGDADFWAGVGEAGIIGAGTSVAYGGTVGKVMKTSGVYADARNVVEHIEQQAKKAQELKKNGSLTNQQAAQLERNIKADYELLSKRLQKVSDKTRARVLENPQFARAFESDGTLKADFAVSLDRNIAAAGDSTYRLGYRSTNLDAETITKVLEKNSKDGQTVTAFDGELDEAGKKGLAVFQESMDAIGELNGGKTRYVVVQGLDGNASFDPDSGVIAINADQFSNGEGALVAVKSAVQSELWQGALVHETAHSTEGTTSHAALADHLISDDTVYGQAVSDFIERGYFGVDADAATDKLNALLKKSKNGDTLTEQEKSDLDTAVTEIVAIATENVLGNAAFIKRLVKGEPSVAEKILNKIVQIRDAVAGKRTAEQKKAEAFLNRAEQLYLNAIKESGFAYRDGKIVTADDEDEDEAQKEKAPDEGESERARSDADDGQKITVNMSDSDRAKILRKQSIEPKEIAIADGFDIDFEQLERNRKSIVEKPLIEKMRKLGFLRAYKTDAVDVEFEFTGGGLRKSMNSQVADYGGNLADLAKVVMNMQQLLDSAVLIEIHTDKAKGTPRENARLVQTYVLLSAFKEKSTVTPVQFEIKQYVDDNNRLYLAVALTKIETGVMGDTALQGEERTRLLPVSVAEAGVMGDTILENQASTRLLPVSIISIPDLIQKINPKDENFFKYVPDVFLSKEQIEAKKRALAREAKKYGRGVQYSMAGTKARTADKMKLATAQRMIAEGVDSETVRRETGWFQGYDGKWRFEIDDSQMEFLREGYGVNEREKLIQEERELWNEILYQKVTNPNGDRSALEMRLKAVEEKYEKTPAVTLPFYVKHDTLFDAYPELRQVKVVLRPNISMGYGIKANEISIDRNLSDKEIKNTLIHEIQHAVQQIEDYSGGANSTYWANKLGYENPEAYQIALDNLRREYRDMRQHSTDSFLAKVKEFLYLTRNTKEQDYSPEQKAMFRNLLRDPDGKSFGTYMHYYQKLMEMDERFGDNHPYKMYLRTAGEVEANDAQRRIDLNAEQRKDLRPDIDRTNVLFADKESVFFGKDVTDFDKIILPDDVKYSGKNVQYAKRRYKQITEEEYAVISSRIAENNAKFMARNEPFPKFGVARSANFFYVYENFIPGEFGVLKQIKIDAVEKTYLSAIEAQIRSVNKSGTYTSTSDVNKMLDVLQGQRRRNRSNHADGSDGRSDRGNGRISPKESQGDGIGNTRGSNQDRRDVKYSGKNVQYAKRRHFAKQDLSTITRASYIHHAWATNELTGCLTPSEISEFNHVIGQMKAG